MAQATPLKTPIKNKTVRNNSAHALREVIPRGSIVNSFPLFDAKIELELSERDYFVKSYAASEPVYLFWKCLQHDSGRIHDMVTCGDLEYNNEHLFKIVQDIWYKNEDPFLKSALFFILNSSSETGLISSGKFGKQKYNPLTLNYLKNFKCQDNLAFLYKKDLEPQEVIEASESDEYNLIQGGNFDFSLFLHGKNRGIEETLINHRKLATFICKTKKKTVITYDFNPKISFLFKKLNFTYIDEYGKITNQKKNAKEIIIANF